MIFARTASIQLVCSVLVFRLLRQVVESSSWLGLVCVLCACSRGYLTCGCCTHDPKPGAAEPS